MSNGPHSALQRSAAWSQQSERTDGDAVAVPLRVPHERAALVKVVRVRAACGRGQRVPDRVHVGGLRGQVGLRDKEGVEARGDPRGERDGGDRGGVHRLGVKDLQQAQVGSETL